MKYTTSHRFLPDGGKLSHKVYTSNEDKYSSIIKSVGGYHKLKDKSEFVIKDIQNGKPGIRHGTKINKQVLADLATAAAREGVPLKTALTTAMRETGIGGGYRSNVYEYGRDNKPNSYIPQQVMQAWDANTVKGIPLDYDQFRLKNNLVSKDRIIKDKTGLYVKDRTDTEREQHAQKYADYLNSFKVDPSLKEPFRKEMRFLKERSGSYNPGEKDRTTKLSKDESVIVNNKDFYNYADSVYNVNKPTMKYTNGRYGAVPKKDWGGALTGASSGFQMGSSITSAFGPVISGIAGGIGAVAGAIFGNRSENKKIREQKRLATQMQVATEAARVKSDLLYKKGVRANDMNQLAGISLNNTSSMFMGKGGKVAVKGMSLTGGNKLITNNMGTTSGTHESGQNIPIKKNGKVLAVAEPGEVLVNDKSISKEPFVLSKKLGFAQQFMNLENMKTSGNDRAIEVKQSKLVSMNNKVAGKGPRADGGINLNGLNSFKKPKYSIANDVMATDPIMIERFKGSIPKKSSIKSPTSISRLSGFSANTSNLSIPKVGGNSSSMLSGSPWQSSTYTGKGSSGISKFLGSETVGKILGKVDMNTVLGAAGTIGNLISSNKTLKYQKSLINNSLNEALKYEPKLAKNYLLNENVDINDSVSAVNQGYASSISGLEGVDSVTKSALKNTANINRMKQLNPIFGERNRMISSIRNQNTAGIMSTNNTNTNTINQSNLMKLNARITANEALGDASAAGLANTQGAISEFNTILRDKDMMNSLKSRWKDSIGTDFMKCGGKVKKRKSMISR